MEASTPTDRPTMFCRFRVDSGPSPLDRKRWSTDASKQPGRIAA